MATKLNMEHVLAGLKAMRDQIRTSHRAVTCQPEEIADFLGEVLEETGELGRMELAPHIRTQVRNSLIKAADALAVADYEIKRVQALRNQVADEVSGANQRRADRGRRLGVR